MRAFTSSVALLAVMAAGATMADPAPQQTTTPLSVPTALPSNIDALLSSASKDINSIITSGISGTTIPSSILASITSLSNNAAATNTNSDNSKSSTNNGSSASTVGTSAQHGLVMGGAALLAVAVGFVAL
ncbi:hypothetical protein BDF19DRAFT_424223 [Syncephalis fuscata]|nr:hypothetical protein BDF19DRAFT_424223 [Syncephalis fuscata]